MRTPICIYRRSALVRTNCLKPHFRPRFQGVSQWRHTHPTSTTTTAPADTPPTLPPSPSHDTPQPRTRRIHRRRPRVRHAHQVRSRCTRRIAPHPHPMDHRSSRLRLHQPPYPPRPGTRRLHAHHTQTPRIRLLRQILPLARLRLDARTILPRRMGQPLHWPHHIRCPLPASRPGAQPRLLPRRGSGSVTHTLHPRSRWGALAFTALHPPRAAMRLPPTRAREPLDHALKGSQYNYVRALTNPRPIIPVIRRSVSVRLTERADHAPEGIVPIVPNRESCRGCGGRVRQPPLRTGPILPIGSGRPLRSPDVGSVVRIEAGRAIERHRER